MLWGSVVFSNLPRGCIGSNATTYYEDNPPHTLGTAQLDLEFHLLNVIKKILDNSGQFGTMLWGPGVFFYLLRDCMGSNATTYYEDNPPHTLGAAQLDLEFHLKTYLNKFGPFGSIWELCCEGQGSFLTFLGFVWGQMLQHITRTILRTLWVPHSWTWNFT